MRGQEAALLAEVLGDLIGKLEATLRPGLARQQDRLTTPAAPSPQTHTPACLAYQEQERRLARQRQAWVNRWYRFCRACGGRGRVDLSDPSVGLWEVEDCEQCTAQGICPRCGQKALVRNREHNAYQGPCLVCWFQFGEGVGHEDDLPPPEPDGAGCICSEPASEPPAISEEAGVVLLAHEQEDDPRAWEERNRAVARRADR